MAQCVLRCSSANVASSDKCPGHRLVTCVCVCCRRYLSAGGRPAAKSQRKPEGGGDKVQPALFTQSLRLHAASGGQQRCHRGVVSRSVFASLSLLLLRFRLVVLSSLRNDALPPPSRHAPCCRGVTHTVGFILVRISPPIHHHDLPSVGRSAPGSVTLPTGYHVDTPGCPLCALALVIA